MAKTSTQDELDHIYDEADIRLSAGEKRWSLAKCIAVCCGLMLGISYAIYSALFGG